MNMQLYHQIAEINTNVNAARTLLAKVEKRQASLRQLLSQRQTRTHMLGSQPANFAAAPQKESSGEGYLDALIGRGWT